MFGSGTRIIKNLLPSVSVNFPEYNFTKAIISVANPSKVPATMKER